MNQDDKPAITHGPHGPRDHTWIPNEVIALYDGAGAAALERLQARLDAGGSPSPPEYIVPLNQLPEKSQDPLARARAAVTEVEQRQGTPRRAKDEARTTQLSHWHVDDAATASRQDDSARSADLETRQD